MGTLKMKTTVTSEYINAREKGKNVHMNILGNETNIQTILQDMPKKETRVQQNQQK